MKPIKYILIRNREGKLELRCSYCCYHRDLLRKDDIFSPLGGGVVEVLFDEEDKSCTIGLGGESMDFGRPKKNDWRGVDFSEFIDFLRLILDYDEKANPEKTQILVDGLDLSGEFKKQYTEYQNQ